MALHGQISVAVVLSDGKFVDSGIQYRGVPVEDDRDTFIDEMNEAAEQATTGPARDRDALKEAICLGVRRVATDWTRAHHRCADRGYLKPMKWTSILAIYTLFWAFSAQSSCCSMADGRKDDATPLVKGQDQWRLQAFARGASCSR